MGTEGSVARETPASAYSLEESSAQPKFENLPRRRFENAIGLMIGGYLARFPKQSDVITPSGFSLIHGNVTTFEKLADPNIDALEQGDANTRTALVAISRK
jgi:hypothetical protein